MESDNWIARCVALLFAIVASIWLYEFTRTLPSFQSPLAEEKGVYQGPPDTPLAGDALGALKSRAGGQSF